MRLMRMQSAPDACPVCGGSDLVSILWGCSTLVGEEAEAVASGRALLGLNRRYFTSGPTTRLARTMRPEKLPLPRWSCLSCSPRWREFHRLTLVEMEVETSKFAAVDAQEFEKAAALLHVQMRLEGEHAADFKQLMIELIGADAVEESILP